MKIQLSPVLIYNVRSEGGNRTTKSYFCRELLSYFSVKCPTQKTVVS